MYATVRQRSKRILPLGACTWRWFAARRWHLFLVWDDPEVCPSVDLQGHQSLLLQRVAALEVWRPDLQWQSNPRNRISSPIQDREAKGRQFCIVGGRQEACHRAVSYSTFFMYQTFPRVQGADGAVISLGKSRKAMYLAVSGPTESNIKWLPLFDVRHRTGLFCQQDYFFALTLEQGFLLASHLQILFDSESSTYTMLFHLDTPSFALTSVGMIKAGWHVFSW